MRRRKVVVWLSILAIVTCTAASAQTSSSTTLSVTSMQAQLVENAQNMALAYCFANRLRILSFEVSMNLTVSIGNSTLTFRDNGTTQIKVDTTDQNYSIGGQSVVAFKLIDAHGRQSSVRVVYSYNGDGVFHLGNEDSNAFVGAFLPTINVNIVSADMTTGEGQVQVTLSLARA